MRETFLVLCDEPQPPLSSDGPGAHDLCRDCELKHHDELDSMSVDSESTAKKPNQSPRRFSVCWFQLSNKFLGLCRYLLSFGIFSQIISEVRDIFIIMCGRAFGLSFNCKFLIISRCKLTLGPYHVGGQDKVVINAVQFAFCVNDIV